MDTLAENIDIANIKLAVIGPTTFDLESQNNVLNNEHEYLAAYLCKENYTTVSKADFLCQTIMHTCLKICLAGNYVFLDNSTPKEKSGLLFIPDNVDKKKQKMLAEIVAGYDYLCFFYNIKDQAGKLSCRERDIFSKENIKKLTKANLSSFTSISPRI